MTERSISERLAELAAQVGGTPELRRTDVGWHIKITDAEGQVFDVIEEGLDDIEGDPLVTVSTLLNAEGWTTTVPAREEQRRHDYRLTFSGGDMATIKATSASEAVRLAGRGQPEQVADLTLIDESL